MERLLGAAAALVADVRNKGLERLGFYGASLASGCVDFFSSDYLGLRGRASVREAGLRAVERAGGVGAGSARAVNEGFESLYACEDLASKMTLFETCTYVQSGFVGNMAAAEVLHRVVAASGVSCRVFLDHRAHASLVMAFQSQRCDLCYFKHRDYGFLRRALLRSPATLQVIVVEALHSMDGDWADAQALEQLCAETGALLYVDEAHSFGICGPRGGGWLAQHAGLRQYVWGALFGCGKAVGVQGAFLGFHSHFSLILKNMCRVYLYTTAASPFVVGAIGQSLEILASGEGDELRDVLQQRTQQLLLCGKVANDARWLCHENSPIAAFLCEDPKKALELSTDLIEKGLIVRPIRYPTVPKGTDRLRLIVHANHTPEQIAWVRQGIDECWQQKYDSLSDER